MREKKRVRKKVSEKREKKKEREGNTWRGKGKGEKEYIPKLV